jgi:hypothetical protein
MITTVKIKQIMVYREEVAKYKDHPLKSTDHLHKKALEINHHQEKILMHNPLELSVLHQDNNMIKIQIVLISMDNKEIIRLTMLKVTIHLNKYNSNQYKEDSHHNMIM